MACIIGLLEMLLSEKLLDEIASSVRQIHRCATSLVAILNSALDIAKVCMPSISFVTYFLESCGFVVLVMAIKLDFAMAFFLC